MDSNLWHPWLFSPHPTCSNDTLDAFPARPDAATMAVTAAGHRSAPMATRLECRPWIAWPPWLGWLMGGASQAIRNVSCRPLREFLGRRVKLARSSTHHWKPQTKGTRSIYFNKYCLFGIPLRIYNKKSLTMKIENATWNYSPIWNQVSLVRHHLVLKRSNRFHRLAQTPGPSESSFRKKMPERGKATLSILQGFVCKDLGFPMFSNLSFWHFRHICFISSSRGSGNFSNSAGSRNGAPSVGEGLYKPDKTQRPNLWIGLLLVYVYNILYVFMQHAATWYPELAGANFCPVLGGRGWVTRQQSGKYEGRPSGDQQRKWLEMSFWKT